MKNDEKKRPEDTEIPSITDVDWAKQNELGTEERVLEYHTKDGTKKVKVIAYIPSGADIMALELKHLSTDPKLGAVKKDVDKYLRELVKLVFRMTGETYQSILDNKSSDLATQLRAFAYEVCGISVTEKEVEREKNLESPA